MEYYKNLFFYNDYFKHVEGITLIHDFTEKEKEQNKYYVGEFSIENNIHPITIRVEIPVTFPHKKLMFYTESLYGYPHLICSKEKESWFCLNSPFAETVEEQLNVEMNRLKDWIKVNIREDIPAIIKDDKVIGALRRAQAYSWENIDEMSEYKDNPVVTFIGDFANSAEYFGKNIGYFNCIKSDSNRYFITQHVQISNTKIPYVIVDEEPENIHDFISLRKQYGWNKKICDHLLPKFDADAEKYYHTSSNIDFKLRGKEERDETKKQNRIAKIHAAIEGVIFPKEYAELVQNHVKSLIDNPSYGFSIIGPNDVEREPGESDEDYQDRLQQKYEEEEYYSEIYPYELAYFLLGIKSQNKNITWVAFNTNRYSAKMDTIKINLGIETMNIGKVTSRPLFIDIPIIVDEQKYFGRGSFTDTLNAKNIAIIGVGAIGSMLAESFARSGVRNLGLWDNDVVDCGNICRSSYTQRDLGNAKVDALHRHLLSISPNVNVKTHGFWKDGNANFPATHINGDLYGNINYDSQDKVLKELSEYDIIIDCTGSNELLHFLAYSLTDKQLLSVCITNHSRDLLLVSNADGNVFDLRKIYLSKIEQDTKNFFYEGSGCYSPTFLARNCDIATLVNLAVRYIADSIESLNAVTSTTFSYSSRGIVEDKLVSYKLKDLDIHLSISTEVLLDADDIDDVLDGAIGYVFGGYSHDGKQIMVTHVVDAESAYNRLSDAFNTSAGIIDYIGDFRLAYDEEGHFSPDIRELMENKAEDDGINTNNPLLVLRTPSGTLKFFLYISGDLKEFSPVNA